MVIFLSVRDEFLETQQAAEELLAKLASSQEAVSDSTLTRLDKLASMCSKLCYGNGLNDDLTQNIHNLIAWCDHLNDQRLKEEFKVALKVSPLKEPW